MSEYNYFGLTAADVVSSFSGAVMSDFSTNSTSGQYIIEKEMTFAEGKILNRLSPRIAKRLIKANGLAPSTVIPDITANEDILTSYLPIDTTKEVEVFYEADYEDAEYKSLCGDDFVDCPNRYLTDLSEVIVKSVGTYEIRVDGIRDGNYWMSFHVDRSLLNIPSLASSMRDIVCCYLGRNLYSVQTEEWKHVTNFCDNAKEKIEVPSELKSLEWFYPLSNSIVSQKIRRA
jgi:hypothetical protein